MIESFLKEWMPEGARSKNTVVLDARRSSVGKSDLRRVFSDRYFEMDPVLNIVIDEAKGFLLTQKSPVVFMDGETLKGCLRSLMGESLNIKIIGTGNKEAANLVREISGWVVLEPQNEFELRQVVPQIDSHFGPLYVHVI